MSNTSLTIDDNPFETDFTLVNTYESPDFTKRRLKGENVALDVATTEISQGDVDAYIQSRVDELSHADVAVPKPYKADIDTSEQDSEHRIEFEDGDRPVGLGYADPEYRIIGEGMDQLVRYRYVVTWRYFPDRDVLAEIEVYVPVDDFDQDAALALADAVTLS